MAQAQTEHITIGELRGLEVFSDLAEPALEWLLAAGQVRRLAPRERLSSHRSNGESYCFLLRGVVLIAVDTDGRQIQEPKTQSKRPPKGRQFLGYFEQGACFSNGYCTATSKGQQQPMLDCIAANAVTLLEVPREPLGNLLANQPVWHRRLNDVMIGARRLFLTHQEPSRSIVQDFFLRENYVTSSVVHVGRLDRCLDCNKCYDACVERHGEPRMARIGPSLGRLTFQIGCRNCSDQPCLPVCKLGAISVGAPGGDIRISDLCNGCGLCARACPNDAISMVRRSYTVLGIEGESHPRVRYVLDAPGEFVGQRALVVGGKEAAVQAALTLADVPNTAVTLSHRQSAFNRLEASTLQRLEAYQAAGRLRVCTKSMVSALEAGSVTLVTEQGPLRIANDVVFALQGERQRAIKCDHCADYGDQACLSACPTGALVELSTEELFKEALSEPSISGRRFSEAPFLNGVAAAKPQRRRREALKTWIMLLTLLLLTWLGVESFLIRTQPESSLLGHVVAATGWSFPVSYTSGRGIGHWFGYIGTGSMLASVLYSLRTRVARFKNWGSQTGWLSAHLWLGFVGATLVTYHAAFKLDRWASIACYLMWIVIVTGAVGRYAFGRVHSAVGLAEFELSALRDRCESFARESRAIWAVRTLLGDDSTSSGKRWTLSVMLWEELRDRLAVALIWAFGTGHLATREERSAMVSSFSDWSAQRRRLCYCQSAKAILRHWNIVHIVVAIAMFILAGIHVVYGFLYKAV